MPLKITCFELTTNVIRTIILIMKTFYFGFLVAFITPTVCVASIYHEMIQQCDKAAETELENALSTVQMTQIINDQKNCYKNVVYKIIDILLWLLILCNILMCALLIVEQTLD